MKEILVRHVRLALLLTAVLATATAPMAAATAAGAGGGAGSPAAPAPAVGSSPADANAGNDSVSAAATLVVDGDDDGDDDYATIQAAVDVAGDGDRIEVRRGTYEEGVSLEKNVTLAAPEGATIANGSTVRGRRGIWVGRHAQPTVTGVTLTGWWRGVSVTPGGGGLTLRDATVEGSDVALDLFDTDRGGTVENVTVRGGRVGVNLVETGGAWTVRDLRVVDVTGEEALIADRSSGDWLLANVTIADPGSDAVRAADSTGSWTIRDTTVRDVPGYDGLDFQRSSGDWSVENTTVRNVTDGNGVDVEGTTGDWTIRNVTVSGTGYSAVEARNATGDWRILDGRITNAPSAVDAAGTRGRWAVHGSALLAESTGVDATGADPQGDATRNWWGQSSGPEPGDCVGNVTCADHLTSPPGGTDDGTDGSNGTPVDVDPEALPGSGTTADPYVVTNASELQAMDEDRDAAYALGSDVDASGTAAWNDGRGFAPVGPNASARFAGSLDGNGHAVTGLTVDRAGNDLGLFGYTDDGARIEDLALTDVSVAGDDDVGGLVGWNNGGTVRDVVVAGDVTGNNTGGGVGGLVGTSSGTVRNVSVDVRVDGTERVGGVAGTNSGTVERVTADGRVEGSQSVGGLVGNNFGTVANASAAAAVNGTERVGGLVGTHSGGAALRDAFATGGVTGSTLVGGAAGSADGNATDVYWDETATGQTASPAGTGLTTAEMTGEAARSNMSGLAFGTVWTTRADDSPVLVAQSPGVSPEPPAGNETLVVDGEADGDDDYATIQAALNDSADGDRVEVRPGTYAEEVRVETDVTLVAPRGATLDGSTMDGPVALGVEGDAAPTVGGFRIEGYRRAVLAFETDGAWTLRNATLVDNRYGITASSSTGDWAVRNVTLRDAESGITGSGATGDWIVADTAVRNVSGPFDATAVDGGASTGNWTVRDVTVENATIGVLARSAEGDWSVRNTSVVDTRGAAVDALAATGDWSLVDTTVDNATTGVVAATTRGDWRVERAVVRDVTVAPDRYVLGGTDAVEGVAVYATDTRGSWAVRNSSIETTERAGVNATNASHRGDATRNWWGQSSGPEPGDCTGNVTCADPLPSDPDAGAGDGPDDGDGGGPFREPVPGTGSDAPPTDLDGDGRYEDVDGDGTATFEDAIALAFADTSGLSPEQTAALDFDSDGDVDFDDAVSLAFQV